MKKDHLEAVEQENKEKKWYCEACEKYININS